MKIIFGYRFDRRKILIKILIWQNKTFSLIRSHIALMLTFIEIYRLMLARMFVVLTITK